MKILRLVSMVVLVAMSSGRTHAQDAYDAWAEFFDAISPDWRGDGMETGDPLIDPDDLQVIADYATDAIRPPTPRELAAFERFEALVPLLESATAVRDFDPGHDFGQGFDLMLPHLGLMRTGARCMTALAHRAAAAGDGDAAFEWASRITSTTGQVGQDGTMIGSLVSGAIYSLADEQLGLLTDLGMLDQELAQAFMDASGWVDDSTDPFGFLAAITMERDIMSVELDRIVEQLEAGDASQLDLFVGMVDPGSNDLLDIDLEEVRRQQAVMEQVYADLVDATNDPDRLRGLRTVQAIEEAMTGPDAPSLVAMALPSISRCLESRVRLETMLADRMRLIEAVASGRLDPASLRNAATLWDRLGGWFERLPASVQLAGLELVDAAPDDARLRVLLGRSVGGAAEDLVKPNPAGAVDATSAPELATESVAAARTAPLRTWSAAIEPDSDMLVTLAADAAAVSNAAFLDGGPRLAGPRLEGDDLDRLRGAGRGLLIDATARLGVVASAPDPDDSAPALRQAIDLELDRAATEIAAVFALVADLLTDPALAHVVLAADLLESTEKLLSSPSAAPLLRDDRLRDRLAAAGVAIPRKPGLGIREAGRRDLERAVDRWFRDLETTRATVLDSLARRGPGRIYSLLTRHAGFKLVPEVEDAFGNLPTPRTPFSLSEGSPYEYGYRPLKLISSAEGMHGVGWVAVPAIETRDDVNEAIEAIAADDSQARRRLAGLESGPMFPVADVAANAGNRLSTIDRLLTSDGPEPTTAEER